MIQKIEMQPVGRRELLRLGGIGALAVVSTSLLPDLAHADAKAVSDKILKKPMSPVLSTCVPPHNSFEKPNTFITLTISPYFSPNKLIAPSF